MRRTLARRLRRHRADNVVRITPLAITVTGPLPGAPGVVMQTRIDRTRLDSAADDALRQSAGLQPGTTHAYLADTYGTQATPAFHVTVEVARTAQRMLRRFCDRNGIRLLGERQTVGDTVAWEVSGPRSALDRLRLQTWVGVVHQTSDCGLPRTGVGAGETVLRKPRTVDHTDADAAERERNAKRRKLDRERQAADAFLLSIGK